MPHISPNSAYFAAKRPAYFKKNFHYKPVSLSGNGMDIAMSLEHTNKYTQDFQQSPLQRLPSDRRQKAASSTI